MNRDRWTDISRGEEGDRTRQDGMSPLRQGYRLRALAAIENDDIEAAAVFANLAIAVSTEDLMIQVGEIG
jgi:hypothetical protein